MDDFFNKYPFLVGMPINDISSKNIKVRVANSKILKQLLTRSGCLSTMGGDIIFLKYYAIYGEIVRPLSACESMEPQKKCFVKEPCFFKTYPLDHQLKQMGIGLPDYIVEYTKDSVNPLNLTIYRIPAF